MPPTPSLRAIGSMRTLALSKSFTRHLSMPCTPSQRYLTPIAQSWTSSHSFTFPPSPPPLLICPRRLSQRKPQSQPQQLLFSTTTAVAATLNQIRKQGRQPKRARRATSPAMVDRPQMKGVCLKVGITKPKKPNSGQRKTAKIRLTSGRIISAYISGEGHNVQQHSVVMVRGGRSQDCPGVRYHLVRGSLDLGGVPNRIRSRSKYGTKKPKTAKI